MREVADGFDAGVGGQADLLPQFAQDRFFRILVGLPSPARQPPALGIAQRNEDDPAVGRQRNGMHALRPRPRKEPHASSERLKGVDAEMQETAEQAPTLASDAV